MPNKNEELFDALTKAQLNIVEGKKQDDAPKELTIESLDEYVISLIKANICSTIRIQFGVGGVSITAVYNTGPKVAKFKNCLPGGYNAMCENVFGLDLKEQYNCCRSKIIEGVRTRIFAIMPPLSQYPMITISTTKQPPTSLNTNIPDEVFNEIAHNNFIIVGPSGSGKTYLMNYMLSKYIRSNEQLAIIEEFAELIPPNDLTVCLLVPPPKPNEKHKLQFVTEQANLMRLDMTCVGEVKGAEAWPLLVQGGTGTRIATTLHGDSVQQGLNRMKALAQQACDNESAINEFIAKSIKYVILMKNKRIEKISKLTGIAHNGVFATTEIYS